MGELVAIDGAIEAGDGVPSGVAVGAEAPAVGYGVDPTVAELLPPPPPPLEL